MKDEFLVAPEHQFILDVVDSALTTINDIAMSDYMTWNQTYPHGSLDFRRIDLIVRFST